MSQTYVIDRIEEAAVFLEDEDGKFLVIPSGWLPPNCVEGDVIDVAIEVDGNESTVVFNVNDIATKERLATVKARRDSIPKGPDGDFSL